MVSSETNWLKLSVILLLVYFILKIVKHVLYQTFQLRVMRSICVMEQLHCSQLSSRVLVCSDLHLGDGSATDDFANNRDPRASCDEFLSSVRDLDVKSIIFNGDTLELVQSKISDIERTYPEIIALIKDTRNFVIKGNHDPSIEGVNGLKLRIGSSNILITHGHNNDPSMQSSLTNLYVYIAGKIETWANDSLADDRLFSAVTKLGLCRPHSKNALEFAIECLSKIDDPPKWGQRFDVAIFGHSHEKPFSYKVPDGGRYLNTGSCQRNNFQGVIFDKFHCFEHNCDCMRVSLVCKVAASSYSVLSPETCCIPDPGTPSGASDCSFFLVKEATQEPIVSIQTPKAEYKSLEYRKNPDRKHSKCCSFKRLNPMKIINNIPGPKRITRQVKAGVASVRKIVNSKYQLLTDLTSETPSCADPLETVYRMLGESIYEFQTVTMLCDYLPASHGKKTKPRCSKSVVRPPVLRRRHSN